MTKVEDMRRYLSRQEFADLVRWLEHPSLSSFRKDVLKPLHRDRLIDYDLIERTVRLLPPGVTAAEELVAADSH
jgi:hypothetical protein